jgi:hypothetical protein
MLDLERLHSTHGDVWVLDFSQQPRRGSVGELPGQGYHLIQRTEETMRIGPPEDPPTFCAVEHWARSEQ